MKEWWDWSHKFEMKWWAFWGGWNFIAMWLPPYNWLNLLNCFVFIVCLLMFFEHYKAWKKESNCDRARLR